MSSRDRFDKFTERARRALQYSQEEAQRFQHNYIGTEHLLLGLIREEEGVAAEVLESLGVELDQIRTAVEFIIGRGDRIILGEIGLTPRAKKVIELAVDEARRMNHHYIGTEHLLLGLVREGEGIAAGVLESLGVRLGKVRQQTLEVLHQEKGMPLPGKTPSSQGQQSSDKSDEQVNNSSETPDDTEEDEPSGVVGFDAQASIKLEGDKLAQLSDEGKAALQLAKAEAQRLQHNYIGTEHLLLGLLRLNHSVAAQSLQRFGIQLRKVREAVQFIIGRGDKIVLGEVGFTPRAKKVIELAIDEAHALGHSTAGSGHLLLGLISEGEGVAVGVIESLGGNRKRIREETLKQMQGQQGS
jgi:ATP-dependent Clp protease ATP-binding subunit ClpA